MNLFTVVLPFLVLLLCKVAYGGWPPLEAEIIPPGQDDICQCGQVNEDQDLSFQLRVIGGTKTPPNRFPWLAGLYTRNRNEEWDQSCGGSLISSQHILTAAHCVEEVGPGQVRVLLGGHSRKYQSQNLRTISNISIHDNYNYGSNYQVIHRWAQDGNIVLAREIGFSVNDIAILTLENKVSR